VGPVAQVWNVSLDLIDKGDEIRIVNIFEVFCELFGAYNIDIINDFTSNMKSFNKKSILGLLMDMLPVSSCIPQNTSAGLL
jgi:hypothetical protein